MPGLTRPPIRRALSVAVQYTHLGDPHVLRGTHHDPEVLTKILTEFMHFKHEDIVILMDDEHGRYQKPTRDNILDSMRALLREAQTGDHFVFHFSGHGDQIPNENGTEEDGLDEIILPVDVELSPDGSALKNFIMDDTIHDILVDHTPPGAHFMMIFDCCHSGTAADLPNSSSKQPPPKSVRMRATAHDEPGSEKHERPHVKHKIDGPDVTSWSACADNENTPDSRTGGIFLRSFYEALKMHKDATRGELLNDITKRIKRKVNIHNRHLSEQHNADGETNGLVSRRGDEQNDEPDEVPTPLPTPELASSNRLEDTYESHVLDEDYPD
ncbi:caspase domain-containing protein [Rhodofomes roseus]|uniref:Caspase domain-containing protein n=1 Tax=Rhodofomes roseus TaxID=34475 RepID=A0ABQ8KF35_9APHY|nr:caspase domain-containing protein [Rhodofomes roseus]KAH9836349.1 caspase domain-containing protein [Rhodofomes roseus]